MTTSFNPLHYLRHAWDATSTVWGKMTIILFYVFIWLQIIWAIELVIAPRKGWECMYEGITEYVENCLVMYLRAMNILTIGFYLYVDRGGIKVWNVLMVFVVNGFWTWTVLAYMMNAENLDGAPKHGSCEDELRALCRSMWVLLIWSFVALVTSVLEMKLGTPSGSASETAPLV